MTIDLAYPVVLPNPNPTHISLNRIYRLSSIWLHNELIIDASGLIVDNCYPFNVETRA